MWDGYPDYFDQATKETLKHLNAGTPAKEAASKSNELGGAARIAPLLALMSGGWPNPLSPQRVRRPH